MSQPIESKGDGSRSQIVTLNRGSNIKFLPYAFTEQGVAMWMTGPGMTLGGAGWGRRGRRPPPCPTKKAELNSIYKCNTYCGIL